MIIVYTNLSQKLRRSLNVHGLLQGADALSTGRILVAIVRMCFEAKKYDLLNDNIVQLTKKRGQLKQVSYLILIKFLVAASGRA